MGIKYRKFEPNQYVIKVKRGKVKEKGRGLSFFYNTRMTSMLVVPTVAIDTGFTFSDIMTLDYQSIYVQGDISFVIEDYEKAASVVDFSFRSEKEYERVLFDAKEKISNKVINAAKVSVVQLICKKDVREAVSISRELERVLFETVENWYSVMADGSDEWAFDSAKDIDPIKDESQLEYILGELSKGLPVKVTIDRALR